MRQLVVLATGLLCAWTASAQPGLQERLKVVQVDPAQRALAVDAGRKASFFCANCHGETGLGKTPEVPNLAGQNPAYLLEQIRKFGSGERKDPFMQGLIKVLKDDERLNIALFYANAKVPPGKADVVQAARGKVLFEKLCVRCHGAEGHGNETIPRLAGQQVPYLIKSVTRYRDQSGERNSQAMAIATSGLKNDEIAALAHYIAMLP